MLISITESLCPICRRVLYEWGMKAPKFRRVPRCPECGKLQQNILRAKPENGVLKEFLQKQENM